MANHNTPTYDLQKPDRLNPTRLLDANVVSGTVEFAVIPYTTLVTYTSGDVIKLCVLPADCQPLPLLSKFTSQVTTGGASTAINIGSAGVPTGYCQPTVIAGNLGDLGFTKNAVTQPVWGVPTDLVADTVNAANVNNGTTIQATVTTGGTLTAGVQCYFLLAYKRGK